MANSYPPQIKGAAFFISYNIAQFTAYFKNKNRKKLNNIESHQLYAQKDVETCILLHHEYTFPQITKGCRTSGSPPFETILLSLLLHNQNYNNNHDSGNHKIRTCAENKYAEVFKKLSDIVKTFGKFFTDL